MVTLPVGDEAVTFRVGAVVQASPKTKDVGKAKELHAAADAAPRRFWEGHRKEAVRLTHKQTVALAGKLYQATVGEWREDPSEPRYWARAVDDVRAAAALLADEGAGGVQPLGLHVEDLASHLDDLLAAEGLHT